MSNHSKQLNTPGELSPSDRIVELEPLDLTMDERDLPPRDRIGRTTVCGYGTIRVIVHASRIDSGLGSRIVFRKLHGRGSDFAEVQFPVDAAHEDIAEMLSTALEALEHARAVGLPIGRRN